MPGYEINLNYNLFDKFTNNNNLKFLRLYKTFLIKLKLMVLQRTNVSESNNMWYPNNKCHVPIWYWNESIVVSNYITDYIAHYSTNNPIYPTVRAQHNFSLSLIIGIEYWNYQVGSITHNHKCIYKIIQKLITFNNKNLQSEKRCNLIESWALHHMRFFLFKSKLQCNFLSKWKYLNVWTCTTTWCMLNKLSTLSTETKYN